jgi:DNA-binding winged helix-turn-helix (wHTH) protein
MSDSGETTENSASGFLISRFGPFTLDIAQRRLARGPVEVHLTPKAFELLRLLVHDAPRVLTKRELHQRLWPETFVTDASLVELVKEIRRALDDHERDAPVIRTVHRVGYALCLEVQHGAPVAASPRHWLVLRAHRAALGQGENVVGRDPAAEVCLDEAAVSRRHARLTIDGSDAWLEDLGSKNGTTIDATPVVGPTRLQDGDRLAFGGIAALYRSPAAMTTETRNEPDPHSPDGRPDETRASGRAGGRLRGSVP